MYKRAYVVSMTVIALLIVTLYPTTYVSAQSKEFVPNSITAACIEVGSSNFQRLSSLFDVITKRYKIRNRIVPATSDVGRLLLMSTGRVDVLFAGSDVHTSARALWTYGGYDWGPQQLQAIWFPSRADAYTLMVRGDSDIHKISDLKGKKVAFTPGSPNYNLLGVGGMLAFGGLTWDDVVKVNSPSYSDCLKAVLTGKADAAGAASKAKGAYELEASPHGIRWLETPESDKEGWNRIKNSFTGNYFMPITTSVGAGLKDNPKPLMTGAPMLTGYADKDENFTYFLAKAIHESYKDFAARFPDEAPLWSIDQTLRNLKFSVVPYHKGAVKYFKEIGKWTDEMDQLNQEMIKKQKKLLETWEKVRDEGLDKQIKAKDFPAYWEKRRAELGV